MRVVIAEDAVLFREGLVRVLVDHGFEVVATAGDADALLRRVSEEAPDLAIVDLRMPPGDLDDGLRAARRIRADHPSTAVLVLSQHIEPAIAMEILGDGSGGVGYLLKDRVSNLVEFADAVRRVGAGGTAVDPAVVAEMVGRRRQYERLDALSAREREVLDLMAQGLTNVGIAERLVVTPRAVEKHVTSIFSKLGLRSEPTDRRRVLAVLELMRSDGRAG